MRKSMMALAAVATVLVAGQASAVATISNTGNNAAWQVSTNGAPAVTAVTVTPTLPSGWAANTPSSSWISVANPADNNQGGPYTYSTTFSAVAGDAFKFLYWVDDSVNNVTLNGVSVFSQFNGTGTYGTSTAGTLTGFVTGTNTLSVLTNNNNGVNGTKNPSGFRFQAAVPEPATWAMMIAGFGLVGGAMRRRSVTTKVAYS